MAWVDREDGYGKVYTVEKHTKSKDISVRGGVPCIEGPEDELRRPKESMSEVVVFLLNDPVAFECVTRHCMT